MVINYIEPFWWDIMVDKEEMNMKPKVTPITPNEVANLKFEVFPPEVFEVFNELIAEKWDGVKAVIHQKEALGMLALRLDGIERDELIQYLNIESVYRQVGWEVKYDKYSQSLNIYETLTFTKAKD